MVYKLLPELHRIRDMLRGRLPQYPAKCCSFTSRLFEDALGFPRVIGYFRNGSLHGHRWSYDPDSGLYVDLTASQFDEGMPDIVVLPRKSAEAEMIYVELLRTPDNPVLAKRRAEFRSAFARDSH